MVFCGKASLSCKNCRVRRIKCNKLEPECSQCIRAGKKCPGYRDQLSLMFRDETAKVRKKFGEGSEDGEGGEGEDMPDVAGPSSAAQDPDSAPAQSNLTPLPHSTLSSSELALATLPGTAMFETQPPDMLHSPDDAFNFGQMLAVFGGHSDHSSPATSSSDSSSVTLASPQNKQCKQVKHRKHDKHGKHVKATPTPNLETLSPEDLSPKHQQAIAMAIIQGPAVTLQERGLQFYLDKYLYGHPESPRKSGDIAMDTPWMLDPSARSIAASVGMAGLGNLRNDESIRIEAWKGYNAGLLMTARTLATPGLNTIDNVMRCIVLMAMFEIVRGANKSFGSANLHVMGAAALLRNYLPKLPPRLHPFRGLVQICYSLLISCHATNERVPTIVIEYVSSTYREKPEDDQIMTKLLLMIADFIDLSAYVHRQLLADGRPDMAEIVVKALRLEAHLINWELTVANGDIWKYEKCETTELPPEACFQGRFHRYYDVSTARIWSYYRWARILLNEMLLKFVDACPGAIAQALAQLRAEAQSDQSQLEGIGAADLGTDPVDQLRRKALRVIRQCADETFVSTPTYWRHPSISLEDYKKVATPLPIYGANGGTGVLALMPTLFHLQVAACATGVPYEDSQWAVSVIETVWAYLGLQQARSLADGMRIHLDTLQNNQLGVGSMLLPAPSDGEAVEWS